jgi:hypothetical protein
MTYKITASPIRGQKIIKTVSGVRELRDYLSECRDLGIDIKDIKRGSRVLQLSQENR